MKSLDRITLPAEMASLMPALAFVRSRTVQGGYDRNRISELELCVEEVLVNIIKYAYPEGSGEMEIACSTTDNGALVMEVIDRGIPFNILSADDPDVSATVDERRIGGLGIFFVKRLMDQVHYRRESGRNIVTLSVNPPQGDGGQSG